MLYNTTQTKHQDLKVTLNVFNLHKYVSYSVLLCYDSVIHYASATHVTIICLLSCNHDNKQMMLTDD